VSAHPLLLPEHAVLLHVGTFKTGTTAIQGALFQARPQLAEHGVLHAGKGRQPMQAVLAFLGAEVREGKPIPRMQQWHALVEQVSGAADKRVVVSSEHLSDADVELAGRAVQALGGPRVQVVVTLRPLGKIMPSQWQQWVKWQAQGSYESWLDRLLRQPPVNWQARTFWLRHRHDELVERWASVVGPENVTVIVPDEADRGFLLRRFEELLGLPAGLLVAERDAENRSMTLGETELVRQINIEFRRRGWSDELYRKVVRRGLGFQMQTNRVPAADEPRITTPQWALDLTAEIGAAAAEKISASGVRVVGDISALGERVSREEPDATGGSVVLPVEAAREAVIGTILSGVIAAPRPVETMASKDLLRIILERVRQRIRARPDRGAAIDDAETA
jgi:hypothetical protein